MYASYDIITTSAKPWVHMYLPCNTLTCNVFPYYTQSSPINKAMPLVSFLIKLSKLPTTSVDFVYALLYNTSCVTMADADPEYLPFWLKNFHCAKYDIVTVMKMHSVIYISP